jgi:hypothetical protein
MAPAACLVAAGCFRAGATGRRLGAAMALVAAYVLAATYLAKLIPLYSGYGAAKVRAAELFRWYAGGTWAAVLDHTALGGARLVGGLAVAVALVAAAMAVGLARNLVTGGDADHRTG